MLKNGSAYNWKRFCVSKCQGSNTFKKVCCTEPSTDTQGYLTIMHKTCDAFRYCGHYMVIK